MAPQSRPPAQHLTFAQEAAPTAFKWGPFALLRRLEALAKGLPRIGRSRIPAQNIVDVTQFPGLGFAARSVERISQSRGRAHVEGHWFGLFGPMGPLPTHLTEYAHFEARYGKKRPFSGFLGLLSGRMQQFFYRAWANSQPAAEADREEDDRFARYLAYLTGAIDGVGERSPFPARARLHYASLFASRRSAIGIQDALTHLLRQPVEVLEYQARWQSIEPSDRSQLGRNFCTLGEDVMIGSRVKTVTDAFRVAIRAGSFRDYETLMPPGKRFAIAAEALDAFAPAHLDWDIAVDIATEDAPPARLDGRARLGWTSWVGKDLARPIRRDAHLRRGVARPKHVDAST